MNFSKELTPEKAAKQTPNIYLVALAAMEAYRLKGGSNDPPDYAIRVCQSILAEVLGFNNRVAWTGKIQAEGLLSYFDYCGDILSMSFEGPLYDVLNYTFGSLEDGLVSIFEKYGVYYELGNAWNLTLHYRGW